MDVRQLRYFIEIVDSGSLSKAAERVFVAQPALSQQLSALEAELKAQLLIRSPRGVTTTEAGKALYRRARTVLREIEHARQEILHPEKGESGLVAVGLPPTISSIVGLPLFKMIRETQPGVHLQLLQGTGTHLAELLADGRLDMCMNYRDTFPPNGKSRVVLDEDFFLVGEFPDGKGDGARLSDLSGVPMILQGPGLASRVLIERAFAKAKVELNVVGDIDSTPCLIAAAAAGLGCTLLPWSAVPRDFKQRNFIHPLGSPGIRRPVSLCFSTLLPYTAAATAVGGAIVRVIDDLISSGQWVGARLRSDAFETTEA